MNKIFYLNHDTYHVGDTKKSLEYIGNLLEQDSNIKKITFLVYQSCHYNDFLTELGVTIQRCQKHVGAHYQGVPVEFHTVKTFNPGNMLVGNPECELLVAVGVPPKELIKFIDKSKLKYWIIIPWSLDENKDFLELYSAVDIESGQTLLRNFSIDPLVKGAILWLNATSYPNAGFVHPLDEKRLKEMANAVAELELPIDELSIINYCRENGILDASSRKIASAFRRAGQHKFHIENGYTLDFLKSMMVKHSKDED